MFVNELALCEYRLMVDNSQLGSFKTFISHSAVDLELARSVHRSLRAADLNVWMAEEEEVELGSPLRAEMKKALNSSDVDPDPTIKLQFF